MLSCRVTQTAPAVSGWIYGFMSVYVQKGTTAWAVGGSIADPMGSSGLSAGAIVATFNGGFSWALMVRSAACCLQHLPPPFAGLRRVCLSADEDPLAHTCKLAPQQDATLTQLCPCAELPGRGYRLGAVLHHRRLQRQDCLGGRLHLPRLLCVPAFCLADSFHRVCAGSLNSLLHCALLMPDTARTSFRRPGQAERRLHHRQQPGGPDQRRQPVHSADQH